MCSSTNTPQFFAPTRLLLKIKTVQLFHWNFASPPCLDRAHCYRMEKQSSVGLLGILHDYWIIFLSVLDIKNNKNEKVTHIARVL